MILLEKTEVVGWEHVIRGMRNPMNSWDKSDSEDSCWDCKSPDVCKKKNDEVSASFCVGADDHELMMSLAKGGPVHAKYRRMIVVYVDITAPLYWWKEFDTYKVGTVANSCSTMHKIHAKEFVLDDFSHEHFICTGITDPDYETNSFVMWTEDDGFEQRTSPEGLLVVTCHALNHYRQLFLDTGDKKYWWQMIQLLPSSYNQKRTIMLNYEVLVGIFKHRRNHKLDEWREFCKWIEDLPYSEIVTCNSD